MVLCLATAILGGFLTDGSSDQWIFVSYPKRELCERSRGVLISCDSPSVHPGKLPWQRAMMSHYNEVHLIYCLCLNRYERWKEEVKARKSENISKIASKRLSEIVVYWLLVISSDVKGLQMMFRTVQLQSHCICPSCTLCFVHSALTLWHLAKDFQARLHYTAILRELSSGID